MPKKKKQNKKTQKKLIVNQRVLFCLFFAMLMAAIYIKYVLEVNISSMILMGILGVCVLFGGRTEILGIAMCCIPLYTSLPYAYAILICMVVYAVKYGKELKMGKGLLLLLGIWLWELFHLLIGSYSFKIGTLGMYPYILCFILMYSNSKKIEYRFLVRLVAVCTICMCFTTMGRHLSDTNFNVGRAFMQMQRLGFDNEKIELTGAYFNPNMLGYLCIFASVGLVQMISVKPGNLLDILMVIALLVFGTMTLSKTYLVCLAAMIVLFILASKNKFKSSFMLFFMIACVILIFTVALPSVLDNFAERWLEEDVTSNRGNLFVQYNNLLISSPKILFFGLGLHQLGDKIGAILGTSMVDVSHNGFQEVLLAWGIPGLILFLGFIASIVGHAKKVNKSMKLTNYIPLILLLLKVQAGQLVTSYYTLLMFSMAYISLIQDFSQKDPQAPSIAS